MQNLLSILGVIAALWRFWISLAGIVLLLIALNHYLPPQHNPSKPLNLNDEVGVATFGKLRHIRRNSEACFAVLERSGFDYLKLEDEETGEGCGFRNALSFDALTLFYDRPLRISCGMATSLAIWESMAVRPLAEELFDQPITEIMTYGTYSCRNIAGSRRRSEHAQANAIDIAGFRLANGETITVKDNWSDGTAKGEFLTKLHRRGCRIFNVVLGPDYNAAHADHFHLDNGARHSCK